MIQTHRVDHLYRTRYKKTPCIRRGSAYRSTLENLTTGIIRDIITLQINSTKFVDRDLVNRGQRVTEIGICA